MYCTAQHLSVSKASSALPNELFALKDELRTGEALKDPLFPLGEETASRGDLIQRGGKLFSGKTKTATGTRQLGARCTPVGIRSTASPPHPRPPGQALSTSPTRMHTLKRLQRISAGLVIGGGGGM